MTRCSTNQWFPKDRSAYINTQTIGRLGCISNTTYLTYFVFVLVFIVCYHYSLVSLHCNRSTMSQLTVLSVCSGANCTTTIRNCVCMHPVFSLSNVYMCVLFVGLAVNEVVKHIHSTDSLSPQSLKLTVWLRKITTSLLVRHSRNTPTTNARIHIRIHISQFRC